VYHMCAAANRALLRVCGCSLQPRCFRGAARRLRAFTSAGRARQRRLVPAGQCLGLTCTCATMQEDETNGNGLDTELLSHCRMGTPEFFMLCSATSMLGDAPGRWRPVVATLAACPTAGRAATSAVLCAVPGPALGDAVAAGVIAHKAVECKLGDCAAIVQRWVHTQEASPSCLPACIARCHVAQHARLGMHLAAWHCGDPCA
jgi:hypothetical protein